MPKNFIGPIRNPAKRPQPVNKMDGLTPSPAGLQVYFPYGPTGNIRSPDFFQNSKTPGVIRQLRPYSPRTFAEGAAGPFGTDPVIRSFKKGGKVTKTGLYMLHKGETVLSHKKQTQKKYPFVK
jgi:hypothetical protein